MRLLVGRVPGKVALATKSINAVAIVATTATGSIFFLLYASAFFRFTDVFSELLKSLFLSDKKIKVKL